MVKMSIDLSHKDEEDGDIDHAITTERSHYEGLEIGDGVTCNVLLKMFADMLQGMGYFRESISRSMLEFLVDENVIDEDVLEEYNKEK
jgi:hypothetical protein